jgi:type II secretory pathway pseudopilin PulG
MSETRRQEGFTLLELVVVGVVVTGLVIMVTFLLRPKDFGPMERDAERWINIAQLTQSLRQYVAEHGQLPDGIPGKAQTIGSEADNVDLCPILVPKYMEEVPLDPQAGVDLTTDNCLSHGAVYTTGYTIVQTKNGDIVVAAPAAENKEAITLTLDL